MLLYGTIGAIQYIPPQTHVWNFTGLAERYPSLRLLPPRDLGASNEYEFDTKYYQYIMEMDITFMDFMLIIIDLYQGNTVYLITSEDLWSQILIESLLKMIQQRYGINGTKICNEEDIFYAEESDFVPGYGLYNLDQDKERYSYLIQQQNMKN